MIVVVSCLWTAAAQVVPTTDLRFDVVVSGPLADVQITQTFENTTDAFVDATFSFPLSRGAVVDAMSMRLDDRIIEARIDERESAIAAYEEALEAGKTAALTESKRTDTFTQHVGNIPPGARIDIELGLVMPVPRSDGQYDLVLPLAEGARFDGVKGEVGARIRVLVEAGLEIEDFEVGSHEAFVAPTGSGWQANASVGSDRDFRLSWRTPSDEPAAAAFSDGSHVLLVLEPPHRPDVPRRKREIFVVLGPGAHRGILRQFLLALPGDDRVRVLGRSDSGLASGGQSPPIDPAPVMANLKTALEAPIDPDRQRYVVVVSDGMDIDLPEVATWIDAADPSVRVHSLGVGRAVDRFVLGELAALGGGVFGDARQGLGRFFEALDRPVLSDIDIDWADWGAFDATYTRVPDLHLGGSVQVLARTSYEEGGPFEISGWVGDVRKSWTVRPIRVERGRAIASTWARRRIDQLGLQQIRTGVPAREEGLPLALEYQVLSPWTAFVAVDPRVRETSTPDVQGPESTSMIDGVNITDPVTGTFSVDNVRSERSYQTLVTRDTETIALRNTPGIAIPIDFEDAGGRVSLELGASERGPRWTAAGMLKLPVIEDQWQLGASVDATRWGVEGGHWQRQSGRVVSRARWRGGARLDLDLFGARTDVAGPHIVGTRSRMFDGGGKLAFSGGPVRLRGELRGSELNCVSCPVTQFRGWTEAGLGGNGFEAGVGAQRTGYRGDQEVRTSTVGAYMRVRSPLPGRIAHDLTVQVDRLWLRDGAQWVPRAYGEVGYRDDWFALVGGGRRIDLSVPELGLPTLTEGYARVGHRALHLRVGAADRIGPNALHIERLTSYSRSVWQQQVVFGELLADFERNGFVVRGMARLQEVLATTANPTTDAAPWVPGLVDAHRPFRIEGSARAPIVQGRSDVFAHVSGGLASRGPGARWYSGVQFHGRGGLTWETRPFEFGVAGEYRTGRPNEVGLDDPAAWFVPSRLGRYGVFVSAAVVR